MRHNDWSHALRLCLAGLIAVVLVALVGVGAAAGGGATWQWNGKSWHQIAFSPGDTVEASSSVWIRGRGLGRPEDGPYFAYLVPPREKVPFPSDGIPDDAIALGELSLDPYEDDATHSVARLTFSVPDVAPGRYFVMHCNEGCKTALGDIMTTVLIVAADEADERATVAIDRLDMKTREHNFLIRRLERKTKQLQELLPRVIELEDLTSQLRARVETLENEDAAAATGRSSGPRVAAGVGVALLAGFGIGRLRLRRPLPDSDRLRLQPNETI